MDFQCDLYVYEHVGGYLAVHIAGSRKVMDLSVLPPKPTPHDIIKDKRAFLDRHEQLMELVDKAESEPIELKYAGEDRQFVDVDQAVEFLEELRELGYKFPDHVIPSIREYGIETEVDEEKL